MKSLIQVTQTAPSMSFDNSSNGFVSNNVQAAIEEVTHKLTTTFTSATNNVSTTSNTFSTISSMSLTPEAGTYLVLFNSRMTTGGSSARGEYGIYIDNTSVTDSIREIGSSLTLLGGLVTISLNTVATNGTSMTRIAVNGSQAINVRFRSINGGTINTTERSLTLIRID